MPNKEIQVTEYAVYDMRELFQKAGIQIDPETSYTVKNDAKYNSVNGLSFYVNGVWQKMKRSVSIKGSDIHRLTVRAGQFFSKKHQYTSMIIDAISKKMTKKYRFSVVSNPMKQDNTPPKLEAKFDHLVVGSHSIKDFVSSSDPDGHRITEYSVRLRDDQKKDDLQLIFDGVNLGKQGGFIFTETQLNWLKLHVPIAPLSDKMMIGIADEYGAADFHSLTVSVK